MRINVNVILTIEVYIFYVHKRYCAFLLCAFNTVSKIMISFLFVGHSCHFVYVKQVV